MTQLKATATEKKPQRWYLTFLSQFHALLPSASYGPPIL